MKILYCANIRFPSEKAHGIQIMKMCEGFGRLCSVTLVVPTRKNITMEKTDPFEYFSVEKNFSIQKIFSLDPHWLMKLPQGIYIKAQSFFFIISLFFYLLFLPKKKEYIFYTREEYLLPLLEFFSQKVFWEGHTLPRNTSYYKKFWKRCAEIIVLTSFLKDELKSLGVGEEKIFVAPDGVDTNTFRALSKEQARQELNLPQDKILAVYTGHLYDWKGAETLASAAEYLGDSYEIIFVGGTHHDVKEFQRRHSSKKNTTILGHKPYREIPKFLSAADVLVLPNSGKDAISKRHTSPLKFFEYLAADKPIVCSDLPSLREVGDKFSGVWYFKPDDPKDLARVMSACLLGQRFARDLTEYTWSQRAKNIIHHITIE